MLMHEHSVHGSDLSRGAHDLILHDLSLMDLGLYTLHLQSIIQAHSFDHTSREMEGWIWL